MVDDPLARGRLGGALAGGRLLVQDLLDRGLEAVDVGLLPVDGRLGTRLGRGGCRLLGADGLQQLGEARLAGGDLGLVAGDLVQQRLVDAVHALHDLHLVDELADRPGREEVGEGVLAAGLVRLGEAGLEPRLRRLQVRLRDLERLLVEADGVPRVDELLVDAVVDLDPPLGGALEGGEVRLGGPGLGALRRQRVRGSGGSGHRGDHGDAQHRQSHKRSGRGRATARLATGGRHGDAGYQSLRRVAATGLSATGRRCRPRRA